MTRHLVTCCSMQPDALLEKAVLVVDGCGELTDLLRSVLEARGFKVSIMRSALAALRTMAVTHFDVVLCDLQGSGMSCASFELAVEGVQSDLAERCVFVAPQGANHDTRDTLICNRPLDIPDLIRTLTFLAELPIAHEDAVLT